MKTKKNMVIGLLCMALVFMGLGYSLLSTTLNITGTSQTSGTFDVKITNVEVDENNTTSGATDGMDPIGNNYAVTETTLVASFNAPGDYITYDITVTNRGSIDAVISIDTKSDSTDSFELSCNVNEGREIPAGEYITFPCRMKFSDDVDDFSEVETAHMTVSLKAVQKATYTPPANVDELPDYIISNSGVLLYSTITDSSVTIPDSYNGKTITAIGTRAFNNVGADGLMAFEYRDEENPIIKLFPFGELSSEVQTMIEQEGVQLVTLDDIVSLNYAFDEIDMSGGPAIAPISFNGSFSSNITSLDLSNMVHLEEIYPEAFTNSGDSSVKIESVIFPSNGVLTDIGEYAFGGNAISSLNLPSSLVRIGSGAFEYNTLTGTLTIPNSVTSIGTYAFYGEDDGLKNQITSLVFESGSHLQTIGDYAFSYNALTGTLTIPSSVTSIGENAFYGNRLQTVYLGNNIEVMGSLAFSSNMLNNSNTLTDIYVDMTEAAWNSTVHDVSEPPSPINLVNWYDNGTTVHFNQS